ncbi:MAG TPA: hypothetical protein VIL40_01665 [Thermaerobacter sp.]
MGRLARRPPAVLDLETGTSPTEDRIVELAALAVHPDGTRRLAVTRVHPEVLRAAASAAALGIPFATVERWERGLRPIAGTVVAARGDLAARSHH